MRPFFFLFALFAGAALIPATGFCAFAKNTPGLFSEMPGALPPSKAKEKKPKGEPVVLSADEMAYDQQNGIVIARGKVEAAQGASIILADQITYFQQRDMVVAEGNVTMLQPSGDVIFAERAELHDAMKRGVMNAFQARLADNSVFVAETATKISPAVTELSQAKYTPCKICQGTSPFWQLNSDNVHIDELAQRVTYDDATMDVYGVPVFYTPYLSHPTPDSDAKSGFLSPQYSNNSNFGTVVRTPYYWRIDNDKDAIITPWFTADDGPMLQGKYRQLTNNGQYQVEGAITDPNKIDDLGNQIPGHDIRGYIFAKGTEHIAEDTDVGFDINRTTDETFLRRYSLGIQPTLFSRVFAEAAEDRNYGNVQALAIQGLRTTDDSRTTPLILPSIQAYYETPADDHGIRYHLSEDTQWLTRDEGVDQGRVSLTAGATVPFVTDSGHLFTSTLNLRQDAYHTANIPIDGSTEEFDGQTYRTIPQGSLEWRYPLVNAMDGGTMTIEPLMLAVFQPNGGNPATISNEDSRLLELTDTNIFSIDRMPGIDLVDSGSRVAYGARSQYLFHDGTSIDTLLGQNYTLTGDSIFPNSTQPDADFSDLIGRVAWNIQPFTVAYRFALDSDNYGLNRSEVSANFVETWLTLSASYRAIDRNLYIDDSKEGDLNAAVPFDDNWSIHAGGRRDFDLNQWVNQTAGVVYKNECFNVMLDYVRSFAQDRDVQPSTEYLVRVGFKNLGEFGGK